MKYSLLILQILLSSLFAGPLFGQFSHLRSAHWGGTESENVEFVAIASDGAVAVIGTFSSASMDLDPGPAQVPVSVTPTVSPANFPRDVFVAKLNPDGSYAWGFTFVQEANTERPAGIAFTPQGDILMAISFVGVLDIDPGPGVTLTPAVANHTAVLKLNGADGTVIDHFVLSSPVFQFGVGTHSTLGITMAPDGGFALHGTFTSNLDLDPGPGTGIVTSSGLRDGFLAKYASDMSFEWSIGLGGTGNFDDFVTHVRFGADGACYVGGFFNSGTDFDPGPGTAVLPELASASDACVVKYAADGGYVWHARMVSPSSDAVFALEVANGEVLVIGRYNTTVDVDPGVGTQALTPVSGTAGTYLVKLSEASGALITAAQFDQQTVPHGSVVFAGPLGPGPVLGGDHFVLIGSLVAGTYDMAIGPQVFVLQPHNGVLDIFMALYSWSDFTLGGAVRIGGSTGSDTSTSIAANETGQFVIGGGFRSSILNVQPTGPVVNLANASNAGTSDAFFAVYQLLTTGVAEAHASTTFRAYPNPASDRVVIAGDAQEEVLIRLFDGTGRAVFEERGLLPMAIDLVAINKGIYLAQIINDREVGTLHVVKE
jgi:hypothetical protein